ncbi:hypothetical protein [Robiginitalea aurantiaca]|uniref:Outer membrane protein beta-barrel domain-containing protein n=1 Tax=Robiginitalea aurantiaca TaxID=3056915 RepID=A0ABT7WDL4_9FLAO|nr:hypothetical protein [Robiginitalea aurantiaca]MDM9631003.1 hypothetical protein [Robiginitalea aurantiaca]
MKHPFFRILFGALLLFFSLGGVAWAQEESSSEDTIETGVEAESEENESRHVLSILLAHDHVQRGVKDGIRSWITLPSFMMAYNYEITERFAVGLAGDIIIEQFELEIGEGESARITERSYPIALVATATYRLFNHLGVLAGGGFEYAKEDTFGLIRMGFEPFLKISPHVDLLLNLSYDIKINAYDNWNLGFGVAVKL